MRLFLSIEAQVDICINLPQIMRNADKALDFITNAENKLEAVNNYGTEFISICIIPTCVSSGMLEALGWKERTLIKRKAREADIRLLINCEEFVKATPEMQRLIYIKTLIDSIEVIQQKSKGDFNGEKLIADILVALDVKKDDLDEISR